MSASEVAEKFDVNAEAVQYILSACKSKLLAVRDKRPKPHLDDKIIVSWNGLMISALSKASRALNNPDLATTAEHCAVFILKNLYIDKILKRSFREGASTIDGVADDYAFLIDGLRVLI